MVIVAILSPIVGSAQARLDPVRWSIETDTSKAALKLGDKLTIQITAKMEEGWETQFFEEEVTFGLPSKSLHQRLPADTS